MLFNVGYCLYVLVSPLGQKSDYVRLHETVTAFFLVRTRGSLVFTKGYFPCR